MGAKPTTMATCRVSHSEHVLRYVLWQRTQLGVAAVLGGLLQLAQRCRHLRARGSTLSWWASKRRWQSTSQQQSVGRYREYRGQHRTIQRPVPSLLPGVLVDHQQRGAHL